MPPMTRSIATSARSVELRSLMMEALVAESGSRLCEVAQKMGIPSEGVAQLCGVAHSIPEKSEEQSEDR